MQYCQIYDPVKLGEITLNHYHLMMKSIERQLIDRQRDLYSQAWLNVQAKATKQHGKKTVPYFKSFDDFFTLDKEWERKKGISHNHQDDDFKALLLKANMR